MRYGQDEKFWVVLDPRSDSETVDILFETSLRSLDLQFKGGLTSGFEIELAGEARSIPGYPASSAGLPATGLPHASTSSCSAPAS